MRPRKSKLSVHKIRSSRICVPNGLVVRCISAGISAFEIWGGVVVGCSKIHTLFCRFDSCDFAQVPRKCFVSGSARPRWFHD